MGEGAWIGVQRDPVNDTQWLYTDGSRVEWTKWLSGISIYIAVR